MTVAVDPAPHPRAAGAHRRGRIEFEGGDLLTLPAARHAGRSAAATSRMIFQEPMSSLNPLMTIGDQIDEAILLHERHRPAERRQAR